MTAFEADWDRFRPVFHKMLRGLHWHHQRLLLDDEVEFMVSHQSREHPLHPDVVMLIGESEWFTVGKVVRYSFAIDRTDPRISISMMMFYDRAQFVVASTLPGFTTQSQPDTV